MGKKLAKNSNYLAKNYALYQDNELTFDSLFSIKIINTDVINKINNCKDDTAAGIDKITIKLLKCTYY